MTIIEIVIYYVGLIVAVYVGYEIGTDNRATRERLDYLDRKMKNLDKKQRGINERKTSL